MHTRAASPVYASTHTQARIYTKKLKENHKTGLGEGKSFSWPKYVYLAIIQIFLMTQFLLKFANSFSSFVFLVHSPSYPHLLSLSAPPVLSFTLLCHQIANSQRNSSLTATICRWMPFLDLSTEWMWSDIFIDSEFAIPGFDSLSRNTACLLSQGYNAKVAMETSCFSEHAKDGLVLIPNC